METVKEKRKKLTKLIEKGHGYYYSEEYKGSNAYEAIAEYLIQNGVTTQECGMDCKNCWKTKLVNPVQEWVSVDERLPEENDKDYYDTVILSLKDGRTVAGCYRSQDKEWWGDTEDGQYSNVTGDVTHWMPLPECPKGE